MKKDESSFGFRGVVEGFYGKPWDHENRFLALDFFHRFGMNIYIIGPKNAPWQRSDWRSDFNNDFLAEAAQLVHKGVELEIQVTYSISPGLSVCYSNVKDREIVLSKFRTLRRLGVTHFCLMWDDIEWELTHDEDIRSYEYIEDAQADFSNWIYEQLFSDMDYLDFTVCPMIYWGRNSNAYIKQLSLNLNPAINIMWTGRQIRSEYLDTSDASIFEADANRAPFYWDNFPVNNLNLRYQLHTGPLQNRDKDLNEHSVGLVANPMNQFWASLLPLSTVGKYLNDPKNYEPWKAWEESLAELFVNPLDRQAATIFFGAFTNSQISNESSPRLRRVLNSALSEIRKSNNGEASNLLKKEISEIRGSIARINSESFAWPKLKDEIKPWVVKLEIVCSSLNDLADNLDDSTRLNQTLQATVSRLEANRYEVFGESVDEFLSELKELIIGLNS